MKVRRHGLVIGCSMRRREVLLCMVSTLGDSRWLGMVAREIYGSEHVSVDGVDGVGVSEKLWMFFVSR